MKPLTVLVPPPTARARPPRRLRLPAPRAWAPALLLGGLLAACGGDDDAAAPPATGGAATAASVSVTASLGLVSDADVSIVCAPSGAVLGTGSTGASGVVDIATSGSCSGPLLVTVSGRADGSSRYFDEALAASLPFPAGNSLRAVVPALAGSLALGVTPLTEIAARQALASAGSLAALSAAQASAANAAVVTQVLGAGVTLDILTPPTPWGATPAHGSLGTGAADRYAFYLAALAHMGQGAAAPALAVATALAEDLADGTLSGSPAGTSGFVYSAAGLAAQLAAGQNAMAAYASAALQGALGVAPPPPLVLGGFAPASGAAGATVTLSGSGFDPDPFHLLVRFSDNLVAEVVSASETTVVVKVPAGAVSGPVSVTNTLRFQTATSSASFAVTPAQGGGGVTGTWVSRASPTGFLLNGLAYGAGRFVAVGFSRNVLTSVDGLRWSTSTPADNNYFDGKAVAWTGSQFVMVGDKNFGFAGPALIATSPDGLVWTRRNWTPGDCCNVGALTEVAAGGGRLTVAGDTLLLSSGDGGATWAADGLPAGVFPTITGLAGNDGTRVAVGHQNFTPTVLVDSGGGWQTAAGVPALGPVPADVTWTGSQFVAVGGRGVLRSTDGLGWTSATLGNAELPAGISLTTVRAVGNTLYATGDNFSNRHAIVQSSDGGATWSLAYEGTTSGIAMLAGLAASPERIVTVGGVRSVTLP